MYGGIYGEMYGEGEGEGEGGVRDWGVVLECWGYCYWGLD